jgi:hypothetical protein
MTYNFDVNNLVSVNVDGKAYSFVGDEIKLGETVIDAASADGKKVLAQFATSFEEFAKVSGHSDEKLNAVYRAFTKHQNAAELKGIKGVVADFEALSAGISAKNTVAVENALIKNPNLFHLLPLNFHAELYNKEKFDLDAIRKVASRVTNFEKELVTAIEGKTLTKDSLTKILRTHGTDYIDRLGTEVKSALNVGSRFSPAGAAIEGFTLDEVVKVVNTEIGAARSEVGSLLQSIASKQSQVENAGLMKKPAQKALAEEVKKLSDLLGKNEGIKHHLFDTIDNHAEKAIFSKAEGMKSIMDTVERSQKNSPLASKGLGEAASKISWLWTKEGAAEKGFMGAVWKNRGVAGKTAVVAGAAAIVYALFAALGNKGPGENAERVRESQNGQAFAR